MKDGQGTTYVLANIKKLKIDMEKNDWSIDAFIFRYKDVEYIVLVRLYPADKPKPQYSLLELEFIKPALDTGNVPSLTVGDMYPLYWTTFVGKSNIEGTFLCLYKLC